MKYAISFDVELDRLVPECWTSENIPQITCAAVYSHEEGAKLFFTPASEGFAPRLSIKDASSLLDELWNHSQKGALIISWGGTAVDFRALSSALSGDDERQRKCSQLVMNHIDIPIASATDIGMMMGLDAAAKGTGQGSKSNLTSTEAPRLWSEGKHKEVLDHVKLDATLTLKVYDSIMSTVPPSLTWSTRSGRTKTWYCYFIADSYRNRIRLSTVGECMTRPSAFVPFAIPSGMDREKAVEWLTK
jgi:hypothetical protein